MSKLRWPFFLLLSALTACSAPPEVTSPVLATPTIMVVSTAVSPTISLTTSRPIPSPSFTSTPRATRYATRRPSITATPTQIPSTKTPTVTPTSVPVVAAPSGLIYSANKGQWRIAANGQPALIITGTNSLLSPNSQMAIKSPNCCRCVCDEGYQLVYLNTEKSRKLPFDYRAIAWSPDSRYIYYIANGNSEKLSDIWRWDVATGEQRNLTRTPNRDEGWWLTLWPEHPDTLVFYSTEGLADGEGWGGYLTIMRTDGTGYEVISQRDVSNPAAFSPDGHTIAYAMYEAIMYAGHKEYVVAPWYYRAGSQPQHFPWKDFGLTQFETLNFLSPSWSQDGQKIAWWMWRSDKPNDFDGLGLFDLESGHAALLNNLTEVTMGGWPDAVTWSPNGKQIAFFAGRQRSEQYGDLSECGIWTAQADGSHLRRLLALNINYNVCDWAWQPDGQWLAISCREHPEILTGIWLAELETGRLLKTDLPDDAQIRGWVNPQP